MCNIIKREVYLHIFALLLASHPFLRLFPLMVAVIWPSKTAAKSLCSLQSNCCSLYYNKEVSYAYERDMAHLFTCRHPRITSRPLSCWQLHHWLYHPNTFLPLNEQAELHLDFGNPVSLLPAASKMLPTVYTVRTKSIAHVRKRNSPYYPNPEALCGYSGPWSLCTFQSCHPDKIAVWWLCREQHLPIIAHPHNLNATS